MSTVPRDRPAETVAGLMASAAIFVSLIALAYRPVRIIPAALLVAFIAAGIGGRHRRLASIAVAVAAICWVVGLTIAIATSRPLY
jgi:hypothetical protein